MKRTTTDAGRKAEAALREFALGFPETHEDFPWGHVAIKVKKKVFLFLGGDESGGLSLSVKLASSHTSALDQPFASPTAYGLGKHGWVSARFDPDETPPLETLRAWIDESYRAIAPKKLVDALSAGTAKPTEKKVAARSTKKPDAATRAPVVRPAQGMSAVQSTGRRATARSRAAAATAKKQRAASDTKKRASARKPR